MPRPIRVLAAVLCLLVFVAVSACKENKGLTITKLEPKTGPFQGGSSVTIFGTGFQSEGAQGVKVYFGDKKARVLSFVGDTKLMVEPPSGELNQTVDVTRIGDDARQLVDPQAYTYTDVGQGFGVDELAPEKDEK